jgi:excisionase family DNA binding protein
MIKNSIKTLRRRALGRAMSVGEFSERYGVGRTLVYSEINEGRLRALKCRRRTLITEADAETWLAQLPTVIAPEIPA